MDDPNDSSSSSESQENQNIDSGTTEEWNISINEEKNFWNKDIFIFLKSAQNVKKIPLGKMKKKLI